MSLDIYKEEILDHYKNPRNQGTLSGKDVKSLQESNASCGDMVEMFLKTEDGKITEVKWKGVGCAISMAATSKMSEWLRGKTLEELGKLSDEKIVQAGVGLEVNPGRIKCLMLPVRVVRKLLA